MKCCEECSYWDREILKRKFRKYGKIGLFLAAAAALFACATPHFEDGTRAAFSMSRQCSKDDCGKHVYWDATGYHTP
jgi:hypothetical protein